VEEPPDEDGGSDDEKAEGLIAAEEAALCLSPFVFGELLIVRFNAAFDHGLSRISIGGRFTAGAEARFIGSVTLWPG